MLKRKAAPSSIISAKAMIAERWSRQRSRRMASRRPLAQSKTFQRSGAKTKPQSAALANHNRTMGGSMRLPVVFIHTTRLHKPANATISFRSGLMSAAMGRRMG
ncbi:MAG: hypothetical protein F4X87_03950 [Chloroflexi bacterium]|nr:hypothetical protein [Chloroflexota bacterium]